MQKFLDALTEMFLYIPRKVFSWLMDGLASILESIPVPSWLSGLDSSSLSIPGEVMYWLAPFQLEFGVSAIVGAYMVRFIIRRIPFIG
jgi:hypothetical protein